MNQHFDREMEMVVQYFLVKFLFPASESGCLHEWGGHLLARDRQTQGTGDGLFCLVCQFIRSGERWRMSHVSPEEGLLDGIGRL